MEPASDRELAKRARKLAEETDDDLIKVSLERYATELEAEALRLERAAVH
jgi:hypothetical protein